MLLADTLQILISVQGLEAQVGEGARIKHLLKTASWNFRLEALMTPMESKSWKIQAYKLTAYFHSK